MILNHFLEELPVEVFSFIEPVASLLVGVAVGLAEAEA